jgi:hypothetical protein
MLSRWLGALMLAVAWAAFPTVAQALPAVQSDAGCYRAGQSMTLTGSGFSPSAPIGFMFTLSGRKGNSVLSSDTTTPADAGGAFRTTVGMPELASSDDRREQMTITANDQSKLGPNGPIGPPEESFGVATVQLTRWDVLVDPWIARAGDPRRLTRFDAFGWTEEKVLWAHYFRGAKRIKSVRIGAVQGACGDLSKRMRQFPFRPVAAGTWTIYFSGSQRFDKNAAWVRYRNVRVPASKAVS